jgi:hypothetical protein
LPIGVDRPRGVSPDRQVIADGAERAQPLPRPRTAPGDDHEPIWPAGDKDVEDLGKLEELVAYFLHHVAGPGNVDLVGLHAGPSWV